VVLQTHSMTVIKGLGPCARAHAGHEISTSKIKDLPETCPDISGELMFAVKLEATADASQVRGYRSSRRGADRVRFSQRRNVRAQRQQPDERCRWSLAREVGWGIDRGALANSLTACFTSKLRKLFAYRGKWPPGCTTILMQALMLRQFASLSSKSKIGASSGNGRGASAPPRPRPVAQSSHGQMEP